jgi:hypothetical protein
VDKHQHGEYDEVQASQRFRQSLVVSDQSPEAVHSAEAAFDNPATWQQDKAPFYFWQLDHFKFNSFIQNGQRWLFSGIALIGNRHGFSQDDDAKFTITGIQRLSFCRSPFPWVRRLPMVTAWSLLKSRHTKVDHSVPRPRSYRASPYSGLPRL